MPGAALVELAGEPAHRATGATVLAWHRRGFQLSWRWRSRIATRYEKEATIITSDKSLTEWGRVLHDSALAAALVDRLLHHGEVYYLKGDSYRLRGKPKTGGAASGLPVRVLRDRMSAP